MIHRGKRLWGWYRLGDTLWYGLLHRLGSKVGYKTWSRLFDGLENKLGSRFNNWHGGRFPSLFRERLEDGPQR